MNDLSNTLELEKADFTQPLPTLARWQPLRIGLVDLYYYDVEEFWFRDGHLLLRGNNGTGKSKVLSLTLPFLFDGQLKSSRIEPDGDSGKKMAWNLLMGTAYDRRIGYTWIEFGRIADDGTPRFLTLGAGLSAAQARPQVDSWFFIIPGTEDSPRINRDVWLTSKDRTALTKERLRDSLGPRALYYDSATQYRRAVDEHLFQLGTRRYESLIETLIQLRQPQLSKKPDENALSRALTESLPPLAQSLLADVAEALGRLEEEREQLEDYRRLSGAVADFIEHYRVYASVQTRRNARKLRQANTDYDNRSRTRSQAHAACESAKSKATQAEEEERAAESAVSQSQAREAVLNQDPRMRDASRLQDLAKDSQRLDKAREKSAQAVATAKPRLAKQAGEIGATQQRVSAALHALSRERENAARLAPRAGLSVYAGSPLLAANPQVLAGWSLKEFDQERKACKQQIEQRRGDIAVVKKRCAEHTAAIDEMRQRQRERDAAKDQHDDAVTRREEADLDFEKETAAYVLAWDDYLSGLQETKADAQSISAMAEAWTTDLKQPNLATAAMRSAYANAVRELAESRAGHVATLADLEAQETALTEERDELLGGADPEPPARLHRDASQRQTWRGAPLWKLIDFQDAVPPVERAGIEASLEAAGLLDAWVSSDGELIVEDGTWPLDQQLLTGRSAEQSLNQWLRADPAAQNLVPPRIVDRLLGSICGSATDDAVDDVWFSCSGHYRLGALRGHWSKPAATYIGFSARAVAREGRLSEIAEALGGLAGTRGEIQCQLGLVEARQGGLEAELQLIPSDAPLLHAEQVVLAAEKEASRTRVRLEESGVRLGEAAENVEHAHLALSRDAADLHLPESLDRLIELEERLNDLRDIEFRLIEAINAFRHESPILRLHQDRHGEIAAEVLQLEESLLAETHAFEEARAAESALRESVGADVDELQRLLREARSEIERNKDLHKKAYDASRVAAEARAVSEVNLTAATEALQDATKARAESVTSLQAFAKTGLFSVALPTLSLPDASVWTIEPALNLARAAEQALSDVKDDDDAWNRIQKQFSTELTTLQGSLSALGHQAIGETTDFGMVVTVDYRNRSERPDQLADYLQVEIAQRSEILTANERAVLENHLQAEIAKEIQQLLQQGERHVHEINAELHKRPTSTGVRYRLVWQPLSEAEGAPVGLLEARRSLLKTSGELWTEQDRQVVGEMLKQKIAAERQKADQVRDEGPGGGLLEQLSRALDYRYWHRFRVERYQDGSWRKLSGPASSGERALGLTVPLFAAVASFYSQTQGKLAPRLMLLDEAFAGIDDAARAHCMGLIREFNLDFVITSEREWGCYAALPGVSICQLLRREGVDAVFVSRWTWDGRAKTLQGDAIERFPPT